MVYDESAYLIGDIGATNVRFAIYLNQKIQKQQSYKCKDFSSIEKAIKNYINTELEENIPVPIGGAIAIACPVIGDEVQMTNHPWKFSISKLQENLGWESLKIVNDFTALSCALPFFSLSDLHKIQDKGKIVLKHPMAVIGPGSGCGASTLISIGSDFFPLPGEAGHSTISGTNPTEDAIIAILKRDNEIVSFETVLSGKGIVNLYKAVCEIDAVKPLKIDQETIVEKALHKADDQCFEALNLFCSFLGNLAGNMTLTVGAKGGLFLAGGIIPNIKDFLETSIFREKFESKEGMQGYLQGIPTYVITHPTPAFVGLKYIINKINE